MPSNALENKIMIRTLDLIEGSETSEVAPQDGIFLVDNWIKVVEGNNIATLVEQRLRELKGQLQLANPDPERIRGILLDLADHTAQIGQSRNVDENTATELEELATAIRKFAVQL
ncbi:hypothetical protein [Nibrella viscosa]